MHEHGDFRCSVESTTLRACFESDLFVFVQKKANANEKYANEAYSDEHAVQASLPVSLAAGAQTVGESSSGAVMCRGSRVAIC